jgi:biopolymer transport protein ExbB
VIHTICTVATTLLAQTPSGPPTGAAAASSVTVTSIWDFIVKGGIVMIPIGICSLVALTVVIERLVSLRRRRIIPASFVPGLTDVLNGDMEDREKAVAYCEGDGSPLANIFMAGIKRLGSSIERLEKQIQEAGEREVVKLQKYLRVLSLVAALAPLLGLLGTVFGMINAFQTVAVSADALGKTELLARGIYEALITTAAGLLVAIPTIVAYHFFAAKIDRFVAEMDLLVSEFLEDYHVETSGAIAATEATKHDANVAVDSAAGALKFAK